MYNAHCSPCFHSIGIDNVINPVQVIPVCSNVWEHSKSFFAVLSVFLLSAMDFGVLFMNPQSAVKTGTTVYITH